MNRKLALRILSNVMDWNESEADEEFRWIGFKSKSKYDSYEDFLAGARFIENMAHWLQQFDTIEERRSAYKFIKEKLIYISTREMNHIVSLFNYKELLPYLESKVAKGLNKKPFEVRLTSEGREAIKIARRKTLFLGMSDGARLDILRRENIGLISNEQVVLYYETSNDKWESLGEKLKGDLNDPGAMFETVYLIDDFTASGTSLLRYDNEKKAWKGKLSKFLNGICKLQNDLGSKWALSNDCAIIAHHYVATTQAMNKIQENLDKFAPDFKQHSVAVTASWQLPNSVKITKETDPEFIKLAEKYYDCSLEDEHAAKSGNPNMRYGYAKCALPLILEHNTPNNSISLIWAETTGEEDNHKMRPLFRRRSRHGGSTLDHG